MNKSAIFPIIIGILVAVSVIHKVRKGMDVLGKDEDSSTSRATTSSNTSTSAYPPRATTTPAAPVTPGHTPPAASNSSTVDLSALPADSPLVKAEKFAAAALEKVRQDPSLTPTQRKLRESEIALMKMEMIQTGYQLQRAREAMGMSTPPAAAPTPNTVAPTTAPASPPASATPSVVPTLDPAPIPAPPPGTNVPST